jgi:hypothetical protein
LARPILPLDLNFVLGYNKVNSDQSDSWREPLSGRRDEPWPGSRAAAGAEFDAVRRLRPGCLIPAFDGVRQEAGKK